MLRITSMLHELLLQSIHLWSHLLESSMWVYQWYTCTVSRFDLYIQGAIVQGLRYCFKERWRTKKPRSATKCNTSVDHPSKGPALKALELPPIPAGEDSTYFERHNRALKLEYAKPHPSVATVKKLMKTTFPMTRDILSEGHKFDVENTPFFSCQIMCVKHVCCRLA